jgi:hypothetical protein
MYKEEVLEVLEGMPNGDIDHEDHRRLAVWISWNGYDDTPENLPDKVAEYAEQEQERYVGDYDSEADFVEQYYQDTATEETLRILNEVRVDWRETWFSAFQWDFEFDEGYVWRQH